MLFLLSIFAEEQYPHSHLQTPYINSYMYVEEICRQINVGAAQVRYATSCAHIIFAVRR